MGGLEETLWGFIKKNSPHALTIIVISDYNEDEVEFIIIERKAFQLVGLEHLIDFSLELALEGFFEVELDLLNILVVVSYQIVV
jgi:hypothetical protein